MIGWMTQTDPPRKAINVLKIEWPVTSPLFKYDY